ncbi:Protein of unknown function [Gryllus bimaculatus]|nr:Protein of unknown function [Gryllus bimaculatus]
MASASKRTLRLELDLLADERGGVMVNYQELAEKALADSNSRAETRTVSPLPPQPKSMREDDQFLPSFRRKKASWNIPDFRALADGYEEDSFIDDSEMFEESIPDSLKYVGYRIRSYASDHSDTESESPSQTLSGYSSLSESNSDASVIELVEPQPPKASVAKAKPKPLKAKEKPKKNSPQKEWSQFLKRLGQNESMEIICLDRKTPVGRPRPSAAASPSSPSLPLPAKQRHPSPRRPRSPPPALPLSAMVLATPTKRSREQAGAKAERALVSPRAIIMVDLCNSPKGKRNPLDEAAATSPVRSPPASDGAVAAACPPAPDPPPEGPLLRVSERGSWSPDSAFASSSTDVSPSVPASPPDGLAKPASVKHTGTGKRTGGSASSAKAANKASSGKRVHNVEHLKRSKQPQLSPTVVALLDEAITKHSADVKREKQDDILLKLGEACRELPAIDRMFVYDKMAVHWGISPKKISRRLSRLRATSDKQPVKNSLSRLNALLVAESKEDVSNENAAALSPKIRALSESPDLNIDSGSSNALTIRSPHAFSPPPPPPPRLARWSGSERCS